MGRIVAEGRPEAVVTSALIEEVYGLRCEIGRDGVSGTPVVFAKSL